MNNEPVLKNFNPGKQLLLWSFAYKLSDLIFVFIDSGVFELLSLKSMSLDEIVSKCGLSTEATGCALDLFKRLCFINCKNEVYSLDEEVIQILPIIKMENQMRSSHYKVNSLENSIRTGSIYDPMADVNSQEFLENYELAMSSSSAALSLHLFRFGKLQDSQNIIDIGGADGAVCEQLSKRVRAKFTVIDRPQSAKYFEQRFGKINNCATFIGLDIRDTKELSFCIKEADTIIMSNILHLLMKSEVKEILQIIATSGKKGCQLIVYDQFLSSDMGIDLAALMVIDWITTGAYFCYTEKEFAELLLSLGYSEVLTSRTQYLPGALIKGTIKVG